ncbi:MAG TPA: hypothetical protein VM364_13780 [Vicinamibacterales bacterium]|nr:hypothetical protein [Vicinamibacterales bacterium]
MFGPIGIPELLILAVIGLLSLVPLAVVVWLGMTLWRLRERQQALEARLDSIQRTVERS